MMSIFLSLTLICALSRGLLLFPSKNIDEYVDADNPVKILLPKEFLLDASNRILIQSVKSIQKVSIQMRVDDIQMEDDDNVILKEIESDPFAENRKGKEGYAYEVNYFLPIQLPPSSSFTLKITYWYCKLNNNDCLAPQSLVERSVEIDARTPRWNVLIMGETDKMIYEPGDTMRFRFIALGTRQLMPQLVLSPHWPKFKIPSNPWEPIRLIQISAAERSKYLSEPTFDSIEIWNPKGNLECKFEDVNMTKALSLSFKIPNTATQGDWKIVARSRLSTKVIDVFVFYYYVPMDRLIISEVILPSRISVNVSTVTAHICAAYKNGSPVRSPYSAQICICDQKVLEEHHVKGRFFPFNTCIDESTEKARFCKKIDGALTGERCFNISANISNIVRDQPISWTEKLGVLVKIQESPFAAPIIVSKITEFEGFSQSSLKLEMANTYKPGIPTRGIVFYRRNSEKNEGNELEVIVREIIDSCNRWKASLSTNPIRVMRLIFLKPGIEKYEFTLPPLNLKNPIHITVRPRHNLTGISRLEGENEKEEVQEVSKTLELWDNTLGPAIKVSARTKKNSYSAIAKSLILEVLSNQALPNNPILTLHFLARGRLATETVILKPQSPCGQMNTLFRNLIKCTDDGEILCLDGWTGVDCLTPECDKNCGNGDETGSVCAAPKLCVCKPDWNVSSCEIQPLKSDTNNNGNNINGSLDWSGKTLVQRGTHFYNASLELDSDFEPDLLAVASISIGDKIISDFIKVDNLETYSSHELIEDEKSIKVTKEFSMTTKTTGENISVEIKGSRGEDAEICALGVISKSGRNEPQKIDLHTYVEALIGYRDQGILESVKSTKDAFRALNIELIQISKTVSRGNNMDCSYSGFIGQVAIEGPSAAPSLPGSHPVKGGISRYMEKNPKDLVQIPEVLIFEAAPLQNGAFNWSFVVPSGLRTWELNAFCISNDRGIWLPTFKPKFKIEKPFIIDMDLPSKAKEYETIYAKIKIIPNDLLKDSSKVDCYSFNITLKWNIFKMGYIRGKYFKDEKTICFKDGTHLKDLEFQIPIQLGERWRTRITLRVVTKSIGFLSNSEKVDGFAIGDSFEKNVEVNSMFIDKEMSFQRILCLPNETASIKVDIPDGIIESSLKRVYVTFYSSPLGLLSTSFLEHSPKLKGIGEIDLSHYAATVYILRFLLQNRNPVKNPINADLAREKLSLNRIYRMEELIKFYHPKTGGFSSLGEAYKNLENTWLTASVFQVLSEGTQLPLSTLPGESLDLQSFLQQSYDFLRGRQSANGCFFEVEGESEAQLRLTAHVLSALQTASAEFKELNLASFEEVVITSIKCVERLVGSINFQETPTYTLAHVAFALKDTPSPIRKRILTIFKRRVETQGSFMWWKAFYSADKFRDLETTALVVLSAGAEAFSLNDRIAILRWLISQNHDANGDFTFTQGTAVVIRAMIELLRNFLPACCEAFVSTNILNRSKIDTKDIFGMHMIGTHWDDRRWKEGPFEINFGLNASKPVCVAVKLEIPYRVPKLSTENSNFAIDIAIDFLYPCKEAISQICVKPWGSKKFGVWITPPTGWFIKSLEQRDLPLKGWLQKTEFDPFKAFFIQKPDNEETDEEVCFEAKLHRHILVENIQPGLVTVQDIENPDQFAQASLNLTMCEIAHSSFYKSIETINKWPLSYNGLRQLLESSLCYHNITLHVFIPEPTQGAGDISSGSMYAFQKDGSLLTWNTPIKISADLKNTNEIDAGFGFFTHINLFDFENITLRNGLIPLDSILNNFKSHRSVFSCYNGPSFYLFERLFTKLRLL